VIARGLVLVHGWAMNAAVWNDLPWPRPWNDHPFALDLPGHGQAQDVLAMDSLQAMAEWVLARAPRDRVWVGWSLGGMVLLQAVSTLILQNFASLPPALVLVGVTPKFINDSTWSHGVDEEILKTFATTFHHYPDGLKHFLHLQLGNNRQQRAQARRLGQLMLAQPAPSSKVLTTGLHILQHLDLRSQLSSIALPVKVLQGERDRVCPAAGARFLAEHLPDAEYISFPHLGHMPFIEQPQQFISALCRDWI